MKIIRSIFVIFFNVIVLFTSGICNNSENNEQTIPLLQTTWGQDGIYARFSPDNQRLGCWSTAIAQILYYHRLQPFGKISYKCSTGYYVSEDFDQYQFDWNRFTNEIDRFSAKNKIETVARYVYFTSVIIEKDYGTGTYVINYPERAISLEEHYQCSSQFISMAECSLESIREKIKDEIENRRPVMMHLRDKLRKNYHAVAIDAFQSNNGTFKLHINMGAEGKYDGWYDFYSPIMGFDDVQYRPILTINPK